MEKHSKVIFFDLYQTLLDVKISSTDSVIKLQEELVGWEAFVAALKKYGIDVSAADFLKLYEKQKDDFYSANRDKKFHHHNMQVLIAEVLKNNFQTECPAEELLDLIYIYRKANRGWLRLYPGVFDTLSSLAKEYTLSTASHTQGSFTQLELRELNIEKLFSYFVYSSDIGLRKESPDFYRYALNTVGKKAADCIMVGDNYDVDILVPKQLGIRSVWIKNPITSIRYPMGQEPPNTLSLENFEKLPEKIETIWG